MEPKVIDLSCTEDLSAKLDVYRTEILSDGYVAEENELMEKFAEQNRDAPEVESGMSWNKASTSANVFRRFLGENSVEATMATTTQKEQFSAQATPLFINSMASAETEITGTTGKRSKGSSMSTSPISESPISESPVSESFVREKPRPEMIIPRAGSSKHHKLGWRLDPSENFSDWEIKIISNSGKTTEYNVHRMALAAGPRSSTYFTDLFASKVREFKNQRLRLEMPDESAEIFPVFLDFVYGENNLESVDEKDQAYAVYDQAEFFETPLLKEHVVKWAEKRMSWEDIPEFLPELDRFIDASPLVKMAVNMCALDFEKLGADFGSKIEPRYLQMIFERLEELGFGFERGVDYISEMILENSKAYPENSEDFLALTSPKYLPIIPVEAVMRMMAEESRMFEPIREASSLQERAVSTLSENWEYFSYQYPNKTEMAAAVAQLPRNVMAKLLVMTTELPK
jgi:hypothetical protein